MDQYLAGQLVICSESIGIEGENGWGREGRVELRGDAEFFGISCLNQDLHLAELCLTNRTSQSNVCSYIEMTKDAYSVAKGLQDRNPVEIAYKGLINLLNVFAKREIESGCADCLVCRIKEETGLKEERGEERGFTKHLVQQIGECMNSFFAARNIYLES